MPTKNTKKTAARPATRRAVKPVAATAPEMHECHCGCRCTPLKKCFYLGGMFILGFLVAYFCVCPCHKHGPRMHKMHPVFVNGCLDTESIKCPKMRENVVRMDLDGNGCISETEFREAKRAMRHEMHEDKIED